MPTPLHRVTVTGPTFTQTYPKWYCYSGRFCSHFSKKRKPVFGAKPRKGRIRSRSGRILYRS